MWVLAAASKKRVVDSHIRKDGDPFSRDFNEPLAQGQNSIAAGYVHDHSARYQLSHERDMLGKNPHLTLHAGKRNHLRLGVP